jgi:hypothetical protein
LYNLKIKSSPVLEEGKPTQFLGHGQRVHTKFQTFVYSSHSHHKGRRVQKMKGYSEFHCTFSPRAKDGDGNEEESEGSKTLPPPQNMYSCSVFLALKMVHCFSPQDASHKSSEYLAVCSRQWGL